MSIMFLFCDEKAVLCARLFYFGKLLLFSFLGKSHGNGIIRSKLSIWVSIEYGEIKWLL